MKAPLGVILAGGLARRMGGGDKGLLPLQGKPLIQHVIDRLAPQTEALAINANGDPDRLASLGLPVLADTVPEHPGPLAGVLAGLDWAATQNAPFIVTAAADTPFLPCDLVVQLTLAGEGMENPLVLAATAGEADKPNRHPTFGFWPTALRDDLRAALNGGLRKVVAWTDQHGARTALFPDEGAFFNVNTPDDLDLAEGMA